MIEITETQTICRLDPRGCGCTDCLTGYSRPIDQASDELLMACARGEIANATAALLDEEDGQVIIWYGQRLQRLDPRGCGCTDCLTGYSRPIDEVTDAQLLACARGELINASGQTLSIVSQVEIG